MCVLCVVVYKFIRWRVIHKNLIATGKAMCVAKGQEYDEYLLLSSFCIF